MNREIQNLAWACLPKEARNEIKRDYNSHPSAYHPYFNEGYDEALKIYFGKHNLTSDTEPEEMLMVERKKVQEKWLRAYEQEANYTKAQDSPTNRAEMYYNRGIMSIIDSLFGDKCLPDKEEDTNVPTPRFKVGDKVVIATKPYDIWWDGIVKTIKSVKLNDDGAFIYSFYNYNYDVVEYELHPYTEPEHRNLSQETANCDKPHDNQLKDNMEEKELNLCELLKGCEGESLFSPTFGDVRLDIIDKDYIGVASDEDPASYKIFANGTYTKNGKICLYPSLSLYEKYPLDPYSAWMEWKEERKPKRWHPKNGESFWCISPMLKPHYDAESDPEFDWESDLNHFETEEMCKQAAEAVRECLKTFHEKGGVG